MHLEYKIDMFLYGYYTMPNFISIRRTSIYTQGSLTIYIYQANSRNFQIKTLLEILPSYC